MELKFIRTSVNSEDARTLLNELNTVLTGILGHNGMAKLGEIYHSAGDRRRLSGNGKPDPGILLERVSPRLQRALCDACAAG